MQYWGIYAFAGAMWFIWTAAWLVVAVIMAIWVYRDAERCQGNGLLWLLVVLITGIIGFIIYLIIRKDMRCSRRRR